MIDKNQKQPSGFTVNKEVDPRPSAFIRVKRFLISSLYKNGHDWAAIA